MGPISLVSYNIAFRKSGLNVNLLPIDKIKGVVTDHTSESNLIVSQFPNVTVIAAPKNQISVIFQEAGVVVNDSSTEITDKKTLILGAIADGINKVLQESLSRYSYNYDVVFDFEDTTIAEGLLKSLDRDALSQRGVLTEGATINFAAFNIVEVKEDKFFKTVITPKTDKDDNLTKQISVQKSVMLKKDELPTISTVANELMSYYDEVSQLQGKLAGASNK